MALPPATEVATMRRNLAERGLSEQDSFQALDWLYEALVELERRDQN